MKKTYYDIFMIVGCVGMIILASIYYLIMRDFIPSLFMLAISLVFFLFSRRQVPDLEDLGLIHEDMDKRFVWGDPQKYVWDNEQFKMLFTEYKIADLKGKGSPVTNGGILVTVILKGSMPSTLEELIKNEGFEKDDGDESHFWKVSRESTYSPVSVQKLATHYQSVLVKV